MLRRVWRWQGASTSSFRDHRPEEEAQLFAHQPSIPDALQGRDGTHRPGAPGCPAAAARRFARARQTGDEAHRREAEAHQARVGPVLVPSARPASTVMRRREGRARRPPAFVPAPQLSQQRRGPSRADEKVVDGLAKDLEHLAHALPCGAHAALPEARCRASSNHPHDAAEDEPEHEERPPGGVPAPALARERAQVRSLRAR